LKAPGGHFRSIAKGPFRHAHRFAALIGKAGIANATMPPASTNGRNVLCASRRRHSN